MVDQRGYAATAWDYAISICTRNTEGAEHDALLCAEEQPTVENVRAALAVVRGKPWQPLFEGALIEIGIAALETVLENYRA